jgi:hypothetical protein
VIDYQKAGVGVPSTEWAARGSASHIVFLEVGIDSVVYSDMLEWDVFDRSADPDDFARITVKELGLPVEFVNATSGQIRWQYLDAPHRPSHLARCRVSSSRLGRLHLGPWLGSCLGRLHLAAEPRGAKLWPGVNLGAYHLDCIAGSEVKFTIRPATVVAPFFPQFVSNTGNPATTTKSRIG